MNDTAPLPALPEPLESALAELLEKQFNLGFATGKHGPKAINSQHPAIKAAATAVQSAVDAIRAAIAAQTAPDAVPQPCPKCHGKGYTDEGDPEIGSALFDCDRCAPVAQQAATYHGLTLDQVKANLTRLNADELRGLVVSLLIQESIAESAAAHTQQPADAQDAARYRLIRSGAHYTVRCKGATFYCGGHTIQHGSAGYGEALDAALDSLLAATPAPTTDTGEQ